MFMDMLEQSDLLSFLNVNEFGVVLECIVNPMFHFTIYVYVLSYNFIYSLFEFFLHRVI